MKVISYADGKTCIFHLLQLAARSMHWSLPTMGFFLPFVALQVVRRPTKLKTSALSLVGHWTGQSPFSSSVSHRLGLLLVCVVL